MKKIILLFIILSSLVFPISLQEKKRRDHKKQEIVTEILKLQASQELAEELETRWGNARVKQCSVLIAGLQQDLKDLGTSYKLLKHKGKIGTLKVAKFSILSRVKYLKVTNIISWLDLFLEINKSENGVCTEWGGRGVRSGIVATSGRCTKFVPAY